METFILVKTKEVYIDFFIKCRCRLAAIGNNNQFAINLYEGIVGRTRKVSDFPATGIVQRKQPDIDTLIRLGPGAFEQEVSQYRGIDYPFHY